MAKLNKVGVLGCGLMGSGIAQVAAQSGYETVVVEVEQKFLDKGMSGIDKSLGKFVEKGKLSAADKDSCLRRLKGSTSLKDLADCDIVVEAITENPKVKKEKYTAIDSIRMSRKVRATRTAISPRLAISTLLKRLAMPTAECCRACAAGWSGACRAAYRGRAPAGAAAARAESPRR